jgi:tetratricopeptide (TPR) repeat protein
MAAIISAAGLLVLISFICWRVRRRWPFALVGWLWFVGTLVPVIGLVQIGAQEMADRYSYLPSIGLAILFVWGFAAVVRNSAVRTLAAVSIIAVYSGMAYRQVSYWKNTETLFTHAATVSDDNQVAHVELGNVAFYRGDLRRAVDEYTKAGRDPHAYCGLGNCWAAEDPKRAIYYYRQALAMRPRSIAFIIQLAMALRSDGQLDEARDLATSAVNLNPADPDARRELDRVLAELAKKKTR